jgi:hypothetical protein
MYYRCYLVNTMTHHYEFICKTPSGLLHVAKLLLDNFPNRVNITGSYKKLIVLTSQKVNSEPTTMEILDITNLDIVESIDLQLLKVRLGYSDFYMPTNHEHSVAFWRYYLSPLNERRLYLRWLRGHNCRLVENPEFVGYPPKN